MKKATQTVLTSSRHSLRAVDLTVSAVCSNDCVFCTDRPQPALRPASRTAVEKKLRSAYARGCRIAEFSAMEPTLNKDLPALAAAAKRTGFEVIHVISNGVRLQDPRYARTLIASGVNKVTISLHSAEKGLEAYLSHNPRAFEQKVQALMNLVHLRRKHPLLLSITTVLTRPSYRKMVPLIELMSRLGVEHVNMYFPKITGNARKNMKKIVPRFSALRKELSRVRDAAEKGHVVLTFVDIPPCIYYEGSGLYGRRLRKQVIGIQESTARLKEKASDIERQRSFGPRCAECAFCAECDGVDKEYIKVYGWREFRPVARMH